MLVKIMIVIVLMVCGGLFFIKGPDGTPFLILEELLPNSAEAPVSPAKKIVYKWQDEEGVWQFSDQPVAREGVVVLELDDVINTIPALPTGTTAAAAPAKPDPFKIPANLPLSVDPTELMDAVNSMQDAVEARSGAMAAKGD